MAAGASVVLLGPPLKREVALPPGDADWLPEALDGDRGRLATTLERCDALVHLRYVAPSAASVLRRLEVEMDANARATAELLEAAATSGVSFVVFTSTASVYPSSGLNREEGPIAPTGPYAVAKVVQEELVRGWTADTGRPAAIMRLSTVYGPGEAAHRAIPRFVRAALLGEEMPLHGDGAQLFSPIFVGDVARAIRTSIELGAGGTFNLGGEPQTIREVAETISRLCGAGSDVRRPHSTPAPGAPLCDCSRAQAVLGLRHTPLQEGLSEEIQWVRQYALAAPPTA